MIHAYILQKRPLLLLSPLLEQRDHCLTMLKKNFLAEAEESNLKPSITVVIMEFLNL
jgi:hypothetical protein